MGTRREIRVDVLVQELMKKWADARLNEDLAEAKQFLDKFVRLISSYSILLKYAADTEEEDAIHAALEQLREAKRDLFMIVHQTSMAY